MRYNTKEILGDINAGTDDSALMEKYQLSRQQLVWCHREAGCKSVMETEH